MATTPRGVPHPAATDPNNVPADLQALASWVNDTPGVSVLTTTQRDALAGAALWDGRVILNITEGRLERYNAGAGTWQTAAVTDHGDLTGLGDNDHPQYTRRATAETVTAGWAFSARLEVPTTAFTASTLAASYPVGLSYGTISTTNGWPINGVLFTLQQTSSPLRVIQFALQHRTAAAMYIRTTNTDDTWTAWKQVAFV